MPPLHWLGLCFCCCALLFISIVLTHDQRYDFSPWLLAIQVSLGVVAFFTLQRFLKDDD